jgi:hypothetical protein
MLQPDSLLRLRIDIFVTHLLLIVARAGKSGGPNPDVCYYLGDRYWRLAEINRRHGANERARYLQNKAEWYLRESGWWHGGPPYGGAMAMPVPKRPTFTAAIGWCPRQGPPDDAA